MRINRVYLEKFKKFSYGYMFMVKKGVFLLFDKDTLEYIGVFNKAYYKEMEDIYPTIERLVALDYLEV